MAKEEEKKRVFESATLALPPLKMVMADSEQFDKALRQNQKNKSNDPARQQAILRLIEKLISKE